MDKADNINRNLAEYQMQGEQNNWEMEETKQRLLPKVNLEPKNGGRSALARSMEVAGVGGAWS